MIQIRCLYEKEPKFPATDQHPDAERFAISFGSFAWCDAVGGEPTQAELEAAVNAPPSVKTTAEKLAALGLTIDDLKAELVK